MKTNNNVEIAVDAVTLEELSSALLDSGRNLVAELTLRLQDHLKYIDHIRPPRARYFRGGPQPWFGGKDAVVRPCSEPVSSFSISLDTLSYALLRASASRALRSCEQEAALRIKDSLHLFRWLGEYGERQWSSPSVPTDTPNTSCCVAM